MSSQPSLSKSRNPLPQYQPLSVTDQVLLVYAGTTGALDSVPVKDVGRWKTEFMQFMKVQQQSLWNALDTEGKLTDDLEEKMKAALSEFTKAFNVESAE